MLDRLQLLECLREIAHETLGVDIERIVETTHWQDDLDADSLDLIEIGAALEDRLCVSIDESAVKELHTVAEVLDMLLGVASGDRAE